MGIGLGIGDCSGGGGGDGPLPPPFPPDPAPWVRPECWLTLPTITPGDQIFAGLFAIFDENPNYVALVAEGDYIVDWGDGNTEDVASGVTAEHQYDFADISPSTLCQGYRQVVITVTPQEGSDLTSLRLDSHSADSNYRSAWLDCAINSPLLTELRAFYYALTDSPMMEHFYLGQNAIEDASSLFEGDYNEHGYLQSLDILELNYATSADYLCSVQPLLRSLTLPDLPLVTGMNDAFYADTALEKLVIGDMPLLEDGSYMCEECNALKQVQFGQLGPLDDSSNLDMTSAFYDCYAFTHFICGDTSTHIFGSQMFDSSGSPLYLQFGNLTTDQDSVDFNSLGIDNPYLIEYIKLGNLPDVTSLSSMCYDLEGLRIFEMGDAPLCEDFSFAWASCAQMVSWTVGDMTAATDMTGVMDFGGYGSLQTLAINTPLCTNYNSAFRIAGMQELTLGDIQGDADFSDTLQYAQNLRTLRVGNILGTTFPAELFSSAPALQEIEIGDVNEVTTVLLQSMPALKSLSIGDMNAVTYLNMGNNPALTIATFGDTPVLDEGDYGFSDCPSLLAAPFVTISPTAGDTNGDFDNFFSGNASMRSIPALDLSGVSNLGNWVGGCTALSWCDAFGAKVDISFESCNFGVDGLVNIFNLLGNGGHFDTVGSILTSSINGGGADFAVNDTFTVDGGDGLAAGVVDSVDGGGAILTYHLTATGSGYSVGATTLTATSGIGTGAGLDILTILAALLTSNVTVTNNPGTPYLTPTQIAIAEDKGWTVVTS